MVRFFFFFLFSFPSLLIFNFSFRTYFFFLNSSWYHFEGQFAGREVVVRCGLAGWLVTVKWDVHQRKRRSWYIVPFSWCMKWFIFAYPTIPFYFLASRPLSFLLLCFLFSLNGGLPSSFRLLKPNTKCVYILLFYSIYIHPLFFWVSLSIRATSLDVTITWARFLRLKMLSYEM